MRQRLKFWKKQQSSEATTSATPTRTTDAAIDAAAANTTQGIALAEITTIASPDISSQTVQNTVILADDVLSTEVHPSTSGVHSRPHVSKTEAWLSRATLFLTFTKSIAEGVGLTPLKAACEGVVTLLEAVQTVQDNRSAWNELILAIKAHLNSFEKQLAQLGINDILEEVEPSLKSPVEEYLNDVTELLADILAESGITEADIKASKLTILVLVQRVGTTKLEAGVINEYRHRLEAAQLRIMRSLILYIASSVGDSKDDAILSNLRFRKPGSISRPLECADGTRVGVLAACKNWSMGTNTPNILWIKGHPGGGKSAIASSLVKELGIKKDRLGSSFFFQRQNATTMTTNALWRTVAYDLARHPTIRKSLATKMKKEEIDLETPNIDILFQQLVQDPLTKIGNISIEQSPIIIIDALDECGGLEGQRSKDRQDLLRTLDSWSKLPRNFKLIVTSREEGDISRLFSRTQPCTIELSTGAKTDTQSKQDIQTFLEIGFKTIAERYSGTLSPDWPGSRITEELAIKAGGLFIWASTAIKFIDAGEPEEQLAQARSGKGTGDMKRLYAQVLEMSFPNPSVQVMQNLLSIVGTVIVAKEPLRSSTVAQLLSITEPAMKHICMGLQSVMETNGELRFNHQSFVDFLLDPGSNVSKFNISLDKAHEALATKCLKIMRNELRFNICDVESSYMLNSDISDLESRLESFISPQLFYASRFWTVHLETASPNPKILDDVRYFLTNQFLFWLEVISWHQLVNRGAVILHVLLKWLRTYDQEDLVALATDMPRFIAHFSIVISQSVPHIYLSALPFVPKRSSIAKRYGPQYPQTLGIEQGGTPNWSPALNILSGHIGMVSSVAFSPDGRRIVSGSYDATLRIWDAETGQQLGSSLKGHNQWVNSVAFSPDGRRIVSGSGDQTVRIWDVETGQQLGPSLEGHNDRVLSVAFSPDGRHIASGSSDKTMWIWDAETCQQLGSSLEGHNGGVRSVAFSPDSRRILSSSGDNMVQIWDVETGQQLGLSLEGHDSWINSVPFSPDGRRIVSGSHDKTVRIWDAETGQQLGPSLEGHNDRVESVAFSPDGRRIASGSNDKTVLIWDAETGQHLGPSLEGHDDWISSVAFSPDGRRIASGSYDKTVRIWDAETNHQPGSSLEGHNNWVVSVAFSPDGRRIISGSDDKTVRIWDVETGRQLGSSFEGHEYWVTSVAFSPDGRRIVSGSGDMTVWIWDANTGQQVGPVLEGHDDAISSVTFSPDGRRIVSGSYDKTVRIWDVETGQQLGPSFEGHNDAVNSVAFSSDGRRIVSGSDDETVRIWDAETGQQIGPSLEGHNDEINSVGFSADSRRIVSGSRDQTVRIWDVETGQQLGSSLEGHNNWVLSVAFSPDGRRIVSGSDDKTVRIWDTETYRQLGSSLEGHYGAINSVGFSPDGRRIVSGSDDKTVRIWDLQHATSVNMTFNYDDRMSDGWVRGPNSERLFWVAPRLQKGLFPPFQVLFIGRHIQTRLDMSKFVHGNAWTHVRGGLSK